MFTGKLCYKYREHLSFFSLIDCAVGVVSKIIAKCMITSIFFLYYFLEVVYFLFFTLRSMIHFKLVFVKDVWSLSRLLLFSECGCLLVPTSFVEKTIVFPWVVFIPFSKISSFYLCGTIWGLSVLFHWPVILPISHCLYH